MSTLWPALLPPSAHGDDSRCLVSASGVRLAFADGSTALCGTSGLWNANLGYGDPVIAEAVAEATLRASYLGTFRWENSDIRAAAESLRDVAGPDAYAKVVFSTSGGAANDLVMKIVRQHHALAGRPERRLVVGLRGGYHGLTFGSFGLTSDDLGQQLYGVDRRLVRHVAPNQTHQLERLLTREGDQVAAVVVEPVLGTGTVPLAEDYLEDLFRLRERYGFLLVADEVATGFGRTGPWFASQEWAERPDLLVSSKGLTNGTCAAAAVLVAPGVWRPFADADSVLGHAETQAGTAVTGAAVTATIERMTALDAVGRGRRVAARLDAGLSRLVAELPEVLGVTGAGCFRSLRVAGEHGAQMAGGEVAELVAAVRRSGAVVHPGPDGISLIPALVYTDDDVDELLGHVRAGLAEVARQVRTVA